MRSNFLGLNAKLALAMLAVCGTVFTSCYEKEEIDVVTPKPLPAAKYFVAGSIYDAATNAAITPTKITVTGAKTSPAAASSFKVEAEANATVTITVEKNGYYTATRTVAVGEAAPGTTNIVNAGIAMTGLSTEITKPSADAKPAPDQTFDKDALTNLGIPNTGKPAKFVSGEATVIATYAQKLPVLMIGDWVSVPYTCVKDGFIITNVTKSASTRGFSGIDDLVIDFLGRAIAQYTDMTYLGKSFTAKTEEALVYQEAAKTVISLNVTTKYALHTIEYSFNSEKYQVDYMTPLNHYLSLGYDTHDSHDSHDGHDVHGSTNAGGGSGSSK
ncbi:MAG: hypothetical protein RR365_07645 [Bacteroides sp.]